MPLKVSHGIGAWIKDFQKSDAPQFKGRSDKERRDQAIAAYLSAKRAQKESNGEAPFSGPYKKKPSVIPGKYGSGPSTAKHLAKTGLKQVQQKPKKVSEQAPVAPVPDRKYIKGTKEYQKYMSTKKPRTGHPTNEEVDESIASTIGGALGQYAGSKMGLEGPGRAHGELLGRSIDYNTRKLIKRLFGKKKSNVKEEAEQVDEVLDSPGKFMSYTTKAAASGLKSAVMGTGKFRKRQAGIQRAVDKTKAKINREEVEIDEVSAGLAKKVAQARDRSAVANRLTPTQTRRLKMKDSGGDPDMNAAKALKSAMKRGAKNVYGEEAETSKLYNYAFDKYADITSGKNKKDKAKAPGYEKIARNAFKMGISRPMKKPNLPEDIGEETTFEVEVDGLPTMYIKAKSQGEVKANLRKIVKQPSLIQNVERITDAEVKKVFRSKAQGRDEEETQESYKRFSSFRGGK